MKHVLKSAVITLIVFLSGSGMLLTMGCSESPATDQRPNVLFISVDDLNDWTGSFGGHSMAVTPNMDRLVEDGFAFGNAHCSAPICMASRNSMLSGLLPSTSGWYDNDPSLEESYKKVLKDTVPLPQHFRNNGYLTMAAGKIYHSGVADYARDELWNMTKPPVKVGEPWKSRGFGYNSDMFYPFPAKGSQITLKFGEGTRGQSLCWAALEDEDIPDGQMPDEGVAEWAVERLNQDYEKPFFLAVGFYRPHVPYVVPKKYFEPYDLDQIQLPEIPEKELSDVPVLGKAMTMGLIQGGDHGAVLQMGEQYWRELIRAYLASVTFVDAQIGKVLDALEDSDHARDTIVVLWSDHGQNLGEHLSWRKMCLWEASTRVPLVFRIPAGSSKSGTSLEPVSLLDVYPTLVELCGLPPIDALEGESLAPFLTDPSHKRETPVLTTWLYGNHSLRSRDWRFTRYRDGSEELYDMKNDPGEHTNLAEDLAYASVKAELMEYFPVKNTLPLNISPRKPDRLDEALEAFERQGLPDWMGLSE